jgi:hypothetical protein
MSIDDEGLPQTRKADERIEQMEKQMEKEDKEFQLIEDKLLEAEKNLRRDPFFPEG